MRNKNRICIGQNVYEIIFNLSTKGRDRLPKLTKKAVCIMKLMTACG